MQFTRVVSEAGDVIYCGVSRATPLVSIFDIASDQKEGWVFCKNKNKPSDLKNIALIQPFDAGTG